MTPTDPPETQEDARQRVARQFIEVIPHAQALGMSLVRLGEGEAEIHMDWNPDFVGDPRNGVIHGGVISALMDTCCGAAVLALPEPPSSTATIDLRIDYMRAATTRQAIRATARCYHVTRSVVFVRAQAHDDDDDKPVAAATGAFTMER